MKEGAEEHEAMGDDKHMATLFQRHTELMLNGDTDSHSAILTSNMRAIRQELCGTQQSGDERGRWHVSVHEGRCQRCVVRIHIPVLGRRETL